MRSRFIVVILAILFFYIAPNCQLNAAEGFALRYIANHQNLPDAIRKINPVAERPFNFQTLLRYWRDFDYRDVYLRTGFELNQLYGLDSSSGFDESQFSYKKFDTDLLLLEKGRTRSQIEIENFHFRFSIGEFDYLIGRQPVSLGTSHFVSVLDVIAPFYPGYLDSSYKPGVDALRIRTYSGMVGVIELIAVAANDMDKSSLIARYRNNFSDIDVELVGGQFKKRKMLGIGWEGERYKINFWGEAAVFSRLSNVDPELGGFSDEAAFSAIAGVEKELGKDWRGGLAWMHQDLGAKNTSDLSSVYNSLPVRQGWMQLAGKSYLLVNARKRMGPLADFSINGILNADDHSTVWQPVVNVSTGNESDISFYAWLKTGEYPEAQGFKNLRLNSEFGSFSTGAGFIYRRFF
ncbi:MAG: hypothetical protein ACQETH_16900 [Candidatus Rifleibacteriota bacterium]